MAPTKSPATKSVKPAAKPTKPAAKAVKAAEPAAKPAKPAKATKAANGQYVAGIRQVAILLKQVSDPTRLHIMLLLAKGECNVTTICSELGGQSQPAVSHHLALLRHGRLISPRRDGKNNLYSLTADGRKLADNIGKLTI